MTSRSIVLVPLFALALVVAPVDAARGEAARSAEQQAVVDVVSSAYVDGIHNFGDPERIRAGFHPGFEMLIRGDGELRRLPIEEWIERVVARTAENPPPADGSRRTSAEYPSVQVSGDAAVCRVEIHRADEHVFTDFLLLYRFEDGWKIVSKIFQRHG